MDLNALELSGVASANSSLDFSTGRLKVGIMTRFSFISKDIGARGGEGEKQFTSDQVKNWWDTWNPNPNPPHQAWQRFYDHTAALHGVAPSSPLCNFHGVINQEMARCVLLNLGKAPTERGVFLCPLSWGPRSPSQTAERGGCSP